MRAATKLRAEQISEIAYVDNALPEAPAYPDQGLPPGQGGTPTHPIAPGGQPPVVDNTLPPGSPGGPPAVDNTLPSGQPKPDNTLPSGKPKPPGKPDQALPPPQRPYPEFEGPVVVLKTSYGGVAVVPIADMTFSQRIKDRNKDEAKPKAQVSITPAGQPVYPQYTTAGSGSLGVPSQELPDDCAKIMPTDWIVVDYSILEDKPIRWVVDDETFKRYFKLAMSG